MIQWCNIKKCYFGFKTDKRKNIRIRGLPELQDRAVVDMFYELCDKKLGIKLEESDIDMAQWSGPAQRDGTRPALITFADYAVKKSIINAARLKLRWEQWVNTVKWVNWERWTRREGGNRLSDRKNRRSGTVWHVWQSTILNISTFSCILVSKNNRIYRIYGFQAFHTSRMLH